MGRNVVELLKRLLLFNHAIKYNYCITSNNPHVNLIV